MGLVSTLRNFLPSVAPAHITYRERSTSDAAVVFVHGFGGDAKRTWGDFPELLQSVPALRGWDVHSVGYRTSLFLSARFLSTVPSVPLLGTSLSTRLRIGRLGQYKVLALVGHSLGGLVIQEALVDGSLLDRVRFVALFGTPSLGAVPPGLDWINPQWAALRKSGDYIEGLRSRWRNLEKPWPFRLVVVAGEADEFVTSASVLEPFPPESRAAINATHSGLAKPQTVDDPALQLVVESLTGSIPKYSVDAVDCARVAVELRDYSEAVRLLGRRAESLDDDALVQLALAYEQLGQRETVLEVLKQNYRDGTKSSSEILGVLGGRLKRLWLTARARNDLEQAIECYREGYERAVETDDHAQGYYHAINLAFLAAAIGPRGSGISADALDWAAAAETHCSLAPTSWWKTATLGDCSLIRGDVEAALDRYRECARGSGTQRELLSAMEQALRLAERVGGDDLGKRVLKAFSRAE